MHCPVAVDASLCEVTCINGWYTCENLVVHPNNAHRLVMNATEAMGNAFVSTRTKSTTQEMVIYCYYYGCWDANFEHNGERFELHAYEFQAAYHVEVRTSWKTKSHIYCGDSSCQLLTFSGYSSSDENEHVGYGQLGELSLFCIGLVDW